MRMGAGAHLDIDGAFLIKRFGEGQVRDRGLPGHRP